MAKNFCSNFGKSNHSSKVHSVLGPKKHFFEEHIHVLHTKDLHLHVLDKVYSHKPDPDKVKEVLQRRENLMKEMKKKYPEFPIFHMKIMGYRLDGRPPEKIIAEGGFLPKEDKVWITTKADAPNNEGLVGFSLLPGLTCLFMENISHSKPYMYAVPIDIGYAMKGEWRQIVTPALPFPNWWCAKRIEEIKSDGTIVLGASEGHHGSEHVAYDEQFEAFLKGEVKKPRCLDYGSEDYEPVWEILDSTLSKEFERRRKEIAQGKFISK